MNRLILTVVLAVFSWFSWGQEVVPVSDDKTTPLLAPEVTQSFIAENVERVLREAPCIVVTTVVTQRLVDGGNGGDIPCGPGPYVIRSVMAKNAVKTKLTAPNAEGEEKFIFEFSFKDGKVQEYLPSMSKFGPHPPYEYTESNPLLRHESGAEITVLPFDQECIIGGHLFSWVSVPAENDLPVYVDMASTMRKKIEAGIRKDDQLVNNRPCYVFELDFGSGKTIVYFDKESYLNLRWDTIQSGIERVRINTEIKIEKEVPAGYDFRILVPTQHGDGKE